MQMRVLRHRGFRNLWLGQLISQFGDAFYFLLFGFMVDRMTQDSRVVSTVMLVQGLPYIFLTPYAGVLADRFDRRLILLWCDIASALVLSFGAVVQWRYGLSVTQIFVLAGSLSVINACFAPAKNASIPRLVPVDELNDANSLSLATQNSVPLLGLLGSSLVLAALEKTNLQVGFAISMAINAASFLGSAYFILRVPSLKPESAPGSEGTAQEFRLGLRYVLQHREIKLIVILSCATQLMIGSFYPAYLAANRQWFGGTYWRLVLVEAGFFAFMVVTSLWLGKHAVRRVGLAFAASVFACGILVAGLAVAQDFILFVVLNALCGICVPFFHIPIQNYIQGTVDDAFRGRVFGFLGMATMGMTPISLVIFGQMIERAGLSVVFLCSGIGFAIVGLVSWLDREFRAISVENCPPPDGTDNLQT